MEFLEVKNGTLREQEVFSNILFMVSVLHFFLINVIYKLLYFVLIIGCFEINWRVTRLLLHLLLLSKELFLKKVRKLWDFEIFSILRSLLSILPISYLLSIFNFLLALLWDTWQLWLRLAHLWSDSLTIQTLRLHDLWLSRHSFEWILFVAHLVHLSLSS